ncbi:MAG: HAD hydrolase-like protein [Acidobacteria bacterium]|nr:HAD hydrolase-like protein [Acidobacteriota bacterium]
MHLYPPGQILMIDADDTLWENNILFDRAIASFIEFLDHKTHTPTEVRGHLNRIEHERVKVHGYGLAAFRESLAICFEELAGIKATTEHRSEIDRFTAIIAGEEMLLLDGVRETLHHLHQRHRLLLVTKGADDEQRKKLRNSGLEQYFHDVEVLREKHTDAYCALHCRHACELDRTWMIGNSPKSDINPALAAGFNAIYIPHPNTWVLEEEEVHPPAEGPRLVTLERFSQLAQLF